MDTSLELAPRWQSAVVSDMEKLPKMMFPTGIGYDNKNDALRTERVNVIFDLIPRLEAISDDNEKGQTGILDRLSLSAETKGFEPIILKW